MPKTKSSSVARAEERQAAHALMSAWGEDRNRIESLDFGMSQERPDKLPETFKRARKWRRFNGFIATVLRLRGAFFNHGFALKPVSGDKADAAKLKEWLRENPNAGPTVLGRYVNETWLEWLTVDNVIALWQEDSKRPLVLNPEDCEYSDTFGREELKITHGLSAATIDALKVSAAMKARLKKDKHLTLKKDDELFSFEVLKWEKLGCGLGWPSMAAVFQVCAQNESMETSDSLWAYISRTIFEQHAMGHEIKGGPRAGMPLHFWKKERADAFQRSIKGKTGHTRITTNFDHVVTFHRPDQKSFDGLKYKSIMDRLAVWAMPLGQMLMAKGPMPQFMDTLRTQAEAERAMMAGHLGVTINECFAPPVPVRVTWGNRCFRDARVAADLLKTGLAAGPLSQEAFIDETGHDVDEERERKAAEARLPKTTTLPIFDSAHGKRPASEGANGRPPGTPDPSS